MSGIRRSDFERTLERMADAPPTAPPPTLAPYSTRVYDAAEPLAWLDGAADWALAKLCGSIGSMFEVAEALARDTPSGPGWSGVVDVNRCPTEWLPWLGQLVGVSIPAGTPDAEARARIRAMEGFERGTPASIIKAAQLHLTGSKIVLLQERLNNDAYALGVYTINSETPDEAQTRADILSQKPAGIVLTYATGPANTYAAVHAGYDTYDDVLASFADYDSLAAAQPNEVP